ncbi:LacI family DNA-binding transcriptional regulator [Paenibacillus thalictri]|uniref:LacI family transcriptional regulator n=1 Tax=Paenibacillus thalictri TaxID=2527873 RepID=A0A4Q9DHH4_9BACL|nr:LacI family DNA-binding transcriptional regulator [Paenibacillus thalictri]TBL72406.1 LacI family transcriptional regulator [Paenibacillus thalictri]
MKPTIKDVAKLAEVSIGTASKVLNREGNVRPDLQMRVWNAIKQLNYRPNAVARSLKSANTKTIAVLLADITNPFQMTLAKGIEEVTVQHGYQLLISSTKENADIEKRNLNMLYENRVEGIIVCTTGQANDEIKALASHIPIVLVDRPVFSLPVDIVSDDNLYGMELLVGHLYELGHRRIGVVYGDLNTVHGKSRYEGVLKACDHFGIDLPQELQYAGQFTYEGGIGATRYFFGMKEPPTALLSANNNMTAGIIRGCRDSGIGIPKDVSVVSFGELEYNWNLITPSVTYVSQSPLMIGHKAAELVLNRLSNKLREVSHILFTPQLKVGDSSAGLLESGL